MAAIRRSGALIAVLAALTLIAMLGAGGGLAIQRGLVPLPAADLRLGSWRLTSGVTDTPACPVPPMPCMSAPPQPNRRYAVIWLFTEAIRPGTTEITARNLLTLPLAPRP